MSVNVCEYPDLDYLLLASGRMELLCRPDPGSYPSPAQQTKQTGELEVGLQVTHSQSAPHLRDSVNVEDFHWTRLDLDSILHQDR